MFFGQAFTNKPQAVHFSSSTKGKPDSSSMWIASNGQTATQSPKPKQPYGQSVSPLNNALSMAQLVGPSNIVVFFLFSGVPLHLTTAICTSFSSTLKPIASAIFFIPSLPAAGQFMLSKLPVFTIVSAKPLQPG